MQKKKKVSLEPEELETKVIREGELKLTLVKTRSIDLPELVRSKTKGSHVSSTEDEQASSGSGGHCINKEESAYSQLLATKEREVVASSFSPSLLPFPSRSSSSTCKNETQTRTHKEA